MRGAKIPGRNKEEKGRRGSREIRCLNRAVREGLAGKGTFGQRPKGGEGGSPVVFIHLGNSVQGRGNSKGKDLEAGSYKELGVARAGRERGKVRPQRACSPATSEQQEAREGCGASDWGREFHFGSESLPLALQEGWGKTRAARGGSGRELWSWRWRDADRW